MRIVACGLIAAAAMVAAAPVTMADEVTTADEQVGESGSGSQAAPQAEVSLLAVSLTVGGAVATIGSGAALALARRRSVNRLPS